MTHFIDRYKQEQKKKNGEEPQFKDKTLAKFKQAATELKEALSADTEATFTIESLDFVVEDYTRKAFEELCDPIFKQILEPIRRILKSQQMTERDIFKVFVVGGSSRMPIVKEILSQMFTKDQLDYDGNPEKTVALGATYLAYLKANPRLSVVKKQLQFKQLYEYVLTEEPYPFLFAFSGSKKWRNTILSVDRETLAT